MDPAEFGEFLNGDRTREIVYLIQGIRHDGYPRTRLQNRRFPDRARPGLGVGDCGLVQQGRTAQPADCSPAGLARSHKARVDEATNQSAVRRSHTAGRLLRAGRYRLPQWRSRGQPLGSDAAVGGGSAASREDEYRRGARGVELLDRVAPKAIAEQKARRVACETVHVSVVTSHYVVPDGDWAAPARAESVGTYRRSTLSRLRRRRVRCRLHPSSRAGASPASSLRHTYETFKYDGVLWSGVRIPHTTNTSSRPERLRHSQRKYFASLLTPLSLSAQVVLAHIGVVEQLAPAALEAVAAELQDEAAVGHGQRLLRVLLDHEDGRALAVDGQERVEHDLDHARVETQRRLVDH